MQHSAHPCAGTPALHCYFSLVRLEHVAVRYERRARDEGCADGRRALQSSTNMVRRAVVVTSAGLAALCRQLEGAVQPEARTT